MDDQLGHDVYIGAYNDTLADQGYTVRVIAGDGYNRTFTSQEVKRSANYLLASKLNGSALPTQINGKNVWPLKLVGANATGGKSIGNVVEIRLEGLPIAPPDDDRRPPRPRRRPGRTVLFDGDLTLHDGDLRLHGLQLGRDLPGPEPDPERRARISPRRPRASRYNATDKKWATMGTMLLDGAGGFDLDSTRQPGVGATV